MTRSPEIAVEGHTIKTWFVPPVVIPVAVIVIVVANAVLRSYP